MAEENSTDELYQFEEKSNRKARNRTFIILGAGAALGAGAVAATAMGFAGPNQEVSILENHGEFSPGFGEDHEDGDGHGFGDRPEREGEHDGEYKSRLGGHDHEHGESFEPDFSEGVSD